MKLVVDLKPALTEEVLRERIRREVAEMAPTELFAELLRKTRAQTDGHSAGRGARHPLARSYVEKITEAQFERLVKVLKGLVLPVTDYAPFEYAVWSRRAACAATR